MKDITGKAPTLRSARATAHIRMPEDVAAMIRDGRIRKGDPREAARLAAWMAAKKTWDLLPHCHPLPLQSCDTEFELEGGELRIQVDVATVSPTGVEMEALTAASVAALTVYDMLKPHAGADLEIGGIRLLEKRGGKSDHQRRLRQRASAAVLSCSAAVADGSRHDQAADELCAELENAGFEPVHREIPDAAQSAISSRVSGLIEAGTALIITVGGTGISPDDVAVDAVEALIEQRLPGVAEAARGFGQARTPLALMSRAVAGRSGGSLLVTFPGSRAGVRDSWAALASGLIHAVEVIRSTRT